MARTEAVRKSLKTVSGIMRSLLFVELLMVHGSGHCSIMLPDTISRGMRSTTFTVPPLVERYTVTAPSSRTQTCMTAWHLIFLAFVC